MDPRLLAQIQAQLQQMAQSSAAAANAAVSLSQALQGAGTATSGSLGKLDSSAQKASQTFSDLTASMPQWKVSMFRLVEAVGKAAMSHVQFAGSMIRLNRTIYETENVFGNMRSQIDAGQNAITNAIGTISTAMQAIPVFGTAFATTLDAAGQAALTIANEQFQLLISASERASDAIKKTNNQYGLLTSNIDLFSKQARTAGLTSEQFGRILSNNANSLNDAFGNVEKGSKFMAKTFEILNTQTGNVFLKQFKGLGLEMDDVAEAVADYAALQRLTSGSEAIASSDQIEGTRNYIQNLKVLQAITGDDIKIQKQRQRELMQNAAFRARMNQLAAKGNQEQANKMLYAAELTGQFGTAAQKAFVEMATSGQIISTESAIFAQQFPELSKMLGQLSAQAQQSGEGMEEFQKSSAKILESSDARIKADQALVDRSGLLVAGLASNSPYLQTLSQGFVSIQDVAGKFSNISKTVDEIQANLKKSAELGTIGEFEFKNLVDQQKQRAAVEKQLFVENQAMLKSTQDFLTSMNTAQLNINKLYSDYAMKVTAAMADLGSAVADIQGGSAKKISGIVDKLNNVIKDTTPTGKTIADRTFEVGDKLVQGLERIVKAIEEKFSFFSSSSPRPSGSTGATGDWSSVKPEGKFSTGGIAAGPSSGYQAILHGIEAVVPLPNGREIPVTLDTSRLETAMDDLVGRISVSKDSENSVMPELVRYLEANNSINREILRELRKGTNISDKILRTNS